jgi:hypothetical protein
MDNWTEYEALFRKAFTKYYQRFDHDLCPWDWDCTELDGALEWMGRVVAARDEVEANDVHTPSSQSR